MKGADVFEMCACVVSMDKELNIRLVLSNTRNKQGLSLSRVPEKQTQKQKLTCFYVCVCVISTNQGRVSYYIFKIKTNFEFFFCPKIMYTLD